MGMKYQYLQRQLVYRTKKINYCPEHKTIPGITGLNFKKKSTNNDSESKPASRNQSSNRNRRST
jgi:hypothetical protein